MSLKSIKLATAGLIMSMAFVVAPVVSTAVDAATPKEEICKGSGGTWTGSGCTPQAGTNADLPTLIRNVINILLYIIGAVSVIMIILGGIKYTTSNGEQSAVTSAKNTILYSVVGIVVAFMAYAIVNFVLTQL